MSSLLKVRPGIRPRFLSQNIAAKLPEKKIPSTAAKATTRSPNVALQKQSLDIIAMLSKLLFRAYPAKRPVRLLLDGGKVFNSSEESHFLHRFLSNDIGQ